MFSDYSWNGVCLGHSHILPYCHEWLWWFLFFIIILFIYFWLCWGFVAVWVSSSCGEQGLLYSCSAWASHCGGFSCCWAWALGHRLPIVVACGLNSCGSQVLEHKLNSCGLWDLLLHSMWDLPESEIKPMSPALAGGCFTTELPGKPCDFIFNLGFLGFVPGSQ